MKRQILLEKLKNLIPSFKRDFIDSDFYGKEGWLYRDAFGKDLPQVIPAHYLEGIRLPRYDGRESITIRRDNFPRCVEIRRQKGERTDRRVLFKYMNYPGHPHLYGEIEIDGVESVAETESGVTSGGVRYEDFIDKYPDLKNASSSWDVELCRIVTDEDINDKWVDWTGYEVGSRTNRFTSIKELKRTAVYVALLRVEGPFYMQDDRKKYRADGLMLCVDENDEVSFFNGTETIIEP